MCLPRGARSCSAICFSPDARLIAVSDMSNDYAMHVFDLTRAPDMKKGGRIPVLATAKADIKQVFMIAWNPVTPTMFTSVGNQHLFVW